MAVQLDYRIEERAPRGTRLEECEDRGCSVTFPLSPAWVVLLQPGVAFAISMMYAIAGVHLLWDMFRRGQWYDLEVVVFWVIPLVLLFGGAAVIWTRSYRRYGHCSRSVVVDVIAGTLSVREERKGRWRAWRLDEVEAVLVKPARRVFSTSVGRLLVVSIRGKVIPLQFRFGARDVAVAERFAENLRRGVEWDSAKRQASAEALTQSTATDKGQRTKDQ